MDFRYDINGLRAIAVIGVVLFHFEPNLLPGGFSGVDVFFVISGYLMTKIIVQGLERGKFSLFSFFIARFNRIVPALSFLCLILLILGWFYLTPTDYKALGKHVASSVAFLSNYIYWSESGYFDASSHSKWLLHTWSLSVEWQFYFIYPILLLCIYNFSSLKGVRFFVLGGTVFGFVVGYLISLQSPTFGYYSLLSRGWGLMLGGVVFLFPLQICDRHKKLFQTFGGGLILLTYFLVSSSTTWPSLYTLIPVIGTLLILAANYQNSFIYNNGLFQYLGKVSYSLYLWHWPIVVLGLKLEIAYWSFVGIPLSLILAHISYSIIETRRFSNPSNLKFFYKSKPVQLSLLFFCVGVALFAFSGIPKRDVITRLDNYLINEKVFNSLSDELRLIKEDNCQLYYDDGVFGKGCKKLSKTQGDVKAVILGDSHAGSLAPSILNSLRKFYPNHEANLINARASGCIPIKGVKHRPGSMFSGCGNYNSYLYEQLSSDSLQNVPVIYVARFNLYLYGFIENGEINEPFIYFDSKEQDFLTTFRQSFIDSICELSSSRNVYIVKSIPEFSFNVFNSYQSQELFYRQHTPFFLTLKKYNDRNRFIMDALNEAVLKCNANILDPLPYLISNSGYVSEVEGVSIYEDASHLNVKGALLFSEIFDEIW
ncbi:hypothetical protein CWB72_05575 [Pseudoalteromonas phenolica]|uniref:acyltransferase family protein n=1 Tax=Pseudoalteromonas phenolica TaxID=161398 RepID=UPI00110AF047|nr:acyltransferase family protein [Pseudoalteromonas phenolica]TMN92354.1 hypothetical protein CWB72_05575 [Pseudoalteromonas phenolica]